MESKTCNGCRSPKVEKECELCGEWSCKKCLHFLDEANFAFWAEKAETLSKTFYCSPCYDGQVTPELERYAEQLAQARQLNVIPKDYKGRAKILKKALVDVTVKDCPDREECLLRLAFRAMELGFNAIIEMELKSEKVRMGAYQTSKWSGRARPAQIVEETLEPEE
jgi:hypothetical protein